jgi:hypothetical protein
MCARSAHRPSGAFQPAHLDAERRVAAHDLASGDRHRVDLVADAPRAWVGEHAGSVVNSVTPAAPWTWMARSTTVSAAAGMAAFMRGHHDRFVAGDVQDVGGAQHVLPTHVDLDARLGIQS